MSKFLKACYLCSSMLSNCLFLAVWIVLRYNLDNYQDSCDFSPFMEYIFFYLRSVFDLTILLITFLNSLLDIREYISAKERLQEIKEVLKKVKNKLSNTLNSLSAVLIHNGIAFVWIITQTSIDKLLVIYVLQAETMIILELLRYMSSIIISIFVTIYSWKEIKSIFQIIKPIHNDEIE